MYPNQYQNPGGAESTMAYCEDETIGCQFDATGDSQSNVSDVIHVVDDILNIRTQHLIDEHRSSDLNSDGSVDVLDVIGGAEMIIDAHKSCTIMSHTSQAICEGDGSDLEDFPYGPCFWCHNGTCMNQGQNCGGTRGGGGRRNIPPIRNLDGR